MNIILKFLLLKLADMSCLYISKQCITTVKNFVAYTIEVVVEKIILNKYQSFYLPSDNLSSLKIIINNFIAIIMLLFLE